MASKLEPYEWEIADKLEQGYTYRQLQTYLHDKHGIDVSYSTICVFLKSNYLSSTVEKGKTDIPVCRTCPNHITVGTNHIPNHSRKSDIRVCKACLEVIPNKVTKSPEWCYLRSKGGD